MLPPRKLLTSVPKSNDFDVIVVGAGVTGLAAARRVAELAPHLSVLVLEAGIIGEGSSGRNSGFLINAPHNTGMAGHASSKKSALKQIALLNTSLNWLEAIVQKHGIACGWNRAGKYHAAVTLEGTAQLKKILEQYQEWGVPYRVLTGEQLFQEVGSNYYRYGYHSDNNVFVQPAALIVGLLNSLPAHVTVWENSSVHELDYGASIRVTTSNKTVRAQRLIIANNGFASKLGIAQDKVFTICTYAGVTPVLAPEILAQLGTIPEWGIIPANRLGTTLRRTAEGRMMVRSAYSYAAEDSTLAIRKLLADCYKRRFPKLDAHTFQYVWGGFTALTGNGATYFGEIRKNVYASIGCNGAGVLKGTMYGRLLGEMACGVDSPDLTMALSLDKPTWLPPEPIRKIVVSAAIAYQKHRAGLER